MRSLIKRPQPAPPTKGQSIVRRRSFNTFAGFFAVFVAIGYALYLVGAF